MTAGLDFCTICRQPLTLREMETLWESDGICNECLEAVEEIGFDIDENIQKRKEK